MTTHYTFDDFREAYLAVQRRNERIARETPLDATPADRAGVRPRRRDHPARVSIALVFLVFFLAFGAFPKSLPGFLAPKPDEHYLLRLLVPIGLYFVVTIAMTRLITRAQNGGARLPLTPVERRARAVALLGYTLLAVPCALVIASADADSRQLLLHDLALLVLPWVVIVLLLYVQHVEPMRRAGGLLRWQWEADTGLHREKTITIDDDAFHLSDSTARYELRWDGLTGIEETDHVFALISGQIFYMLPKRILTPEQIAYVRSIFTPEARKPTGGFPVLPSKT